MSEISTYQASMQVIAIQLNGLFIGSGPNGTSFRGGELVLDQISPDLDQLVLLSQQAGEQTARYLQEGSLDEQEAAEYKLLGQAGAQLRVANELLVQASAASQAAEAGKLTSPGQFRAADSATLIVAVDELAQAIAQPLEVPSGEMRGDGDLPEDQDSARVFLARESAASLRAISRQASKVGGEAAQTLLAFNPETLKLGASMLGKDVVAWLEETVQSVMVVVRKIVASALELIVQAYEWVARMLGKDLEAQAKEKINTWLDELRQAVSGKDGKTLVEELVTRLYTIDAIQKDVFAWTQATQADLAALHQATRAVQQLSQKYLQKTNQVSHFLQGIGLVRMVPLPFLKLPQAQVVIAGLVTALLAYVVYSGYDHVDSGRIIFYKKFGVHIPDRVTGVRETVKTALKVQ
jgi:hypothetical protein